MLNKTFYKLTNVQKNILELEMVNGAGTPVNHILSLMKLKGRLDENILIKTINKIIEVNDAFRLKFIKNGYSYYQYVSEYEFVPIKTLYQDNEDISEIIEEYQSKHISLNKLYIFSILYTPNYTYIFYKSHHIISDAWSATQVAEQIKEFYKKICTDENFDSFKIPSYIDYIDREIKYLESNKYIKDEDFWSEYVKNISTTKIFNNVHTEKKANRYEYQISNRLFNNISNFCRINEITESSFFLGVLSIFFNKIYNSSNIVFGTPFLNRQKKYDELKTIGMFVSTLPLMIDIDANTSFVSLCKNIVSTNISLFRHSKFPYSKIQELYYKYSNENTPLYEIGFSYQINKQENRFKNNDLGEYKWVFSNTQNNPLIIHLTSFNNRKIINYDYLNSCFSLSEIEKMHQIIMLIISQVLAGKNNLSELSVMTKEDVKSFQLINNTGHLKHTNITVPYIFNKIVKKFPHNTAIDFDNTKISYKELDNKINNIATILKKFGVTQNTPVVLFFDKSIEMIASMFAILKAGGCYVPILPDEGKSRIEYILKDCNPICILTHKGYEKIIPDNYITINVDKIEQNKQLDIDISKISTDDVAYIIYTSGSTGNPKGTMVTHKNICALRNSIKRDSTLTASDKDVSISLLKYSFDASGIDIYSSLLFGGKLILVKKEDELNPEKVVKILEKKKVTRAFLIPKWIEHISIQDKLINSDLSSLRILGTGGETLKPYIIEHLLTKYSNLKVLNLYGPTETTMFTTCKEISVYEIKNNYTSIGKPIYGSRIAVINSNLDFVPIGYKGELIIYEDKNSLQNIAKGYLNLPEQTNNKFIQIYHPILKRQIKAYRTGDIVKINKNLEIDFIGRDDDIVKVNGGYLVALNELEKKLQDLLGEYFDTYPIAIPYNNTKIITLYVSKKNKNISIDIAKEIINNNISFYMKPKKIIELDEFPRNTSGKIDRKELKRIALKYIEDNKNRFISPQTQIELEIYNYVKELLGTTEISINDDFMDDLGIDSLSLTALYTYLEKYNIKIQDIYNNSNIKDLAYFIENNNISRLEPDLNNIESIKILNNVKSFKLTSILLTGVTGFLGIHLLKDLLLNDNVKEIYCIIRNKVDLTGEQRLKKMIEYYFNNNQNIVKLSEQKVHILNGDISAEKFGLSENQYMEISNNITTVINSAANVRHFAKLSTLRNDNVKSIKHLVDFCGNTKSLAHISTLSVAGFTNEYSQNKIFDENTLYINQDFNNNPYLISKFEAEKIVLEATNKNGLNAIIFRLGNIMPRKSDGIFQINANQNIFLMTLKSILDCGLIAKDLLNVNIEFSPVDECSNIIINLLNNHSPNSIYHILNNNLITISELKTILKFLKYDISIVDLNVFINEIENYADEYSKQYIFNNNINIYKQDLTMEKMKNLDLTWSLPELNYIQKILNILKKI